MYRQVTIVAQSNGAFGKPTTKPNPAIGHADVENAFETYLRKYNHGRGFVLIGHSQGAFRAAPDDRQRVDPKPAVRSCWSRRS